MPVKRHCEWCGAYSENAFYRFIGETENVFFLNSPFISKIDTESKSIILKTGQVMSYLGLTAPDQAVSVTDFIPHIFCSEKCEDEFIQKHTVVYRNDLHLQTAVLNNQQNGIFSPLNVAIENLKHQSFRCEICNNYFPNLSKSFTCDSISDSKTLEGTLAQPPVDYFSHYPITFSDMNNQYPNGSWYLFNVDHDQTSKKQFCSNECAFEYAKLNNSFIVFKSNMLTGLLTSINPFTVLINQGLKNKYLYRPQKLKS